jgi:hypothetical protein
MAAAKPPRPAPITTMSKLDEVAEGMIINEYAKRVIGRD